MLPQNWSKCTGTIGILGPFDDFLEAALERQQPAGPADRAFGENAHDMAVVEFVARVLERLHDIAPIVADTGIECMRRKNQLSDLRS